MKDIDINSHPVQLWGYASRRDAQKEVLGRVAAHFEDDAIAQFSIRKKLSTTTFDEIYTVFPIEEERVNKAFIKDYP
jgi:hypothetical protein